MKCIILLFEFYKENEIKKEKPLKEGLIKESTELA